MQPVNPRGDFIDLFPRDKHVVERTIELGEQLTAVAKRQLNLLAFRHIKTLA